MEAPDFWDDAEVSQQKMKELKSMKDDLEIYHSLETQMEDMETMIEMGYEENDPEIIPEIQEMLDEFEKNFDSIRVKTLLSGEYDSENAIIKLNAGAGGTEACDWCGMLYRNDSDLLHAVAHSYRHGVVLQGLKIHRYAKRRAYFVLSAVPFADASRLVIVHVKAFCQPVADLRCVFSQLFLQRQHSRLEGGKRGVES